jgi:GGDEF domain-containing protein
MFANRRNQERGITRLPKQLDVPGLKQLQSLQAECHHAPGKTMQLPFGSPPEDYSLAVFTDRSSGGLHWALYREDGAASMLVWDQISHDPVCIYQLISAQFPGVDMKQIAVRTATPADLQYTQSSTGNLALPAMSEMSSSGSLMRPKPTLEGDLVNMQIASLLQSISMNRAFGRLELEFGRETATVYFTEGVPMHCLAAGLQGEAAFIEVVSLEEGNFRFYQEQWQGEKTIRRRLDTLLMEGAALDDQFQALKKKGIGPQSYLVKKDPNLTEKRFKEIVEAGAGADMELQRQFYLAIDNRVRLQDILRKFNVAKQVWVPILFNFLTCNLVDFYDQLPASLNPDQPQILIDWSQALMAERTLLRKDTGIYSYPAFLYHLGRESQRFERFGSPFSVIVLNIMMQALSPSSSFIEPISLEVLPQVVERIEKIKRKTDLLAHFETFGLVLLLVESDAKALQGLSERLVDSLMSTPVMAGGGFSARGYRLRVSLGRACLPDDTTDLNQLLSLARPSKLENLG